MGNDGDNVQSQKLAMTQQMRQAIKILQLSTYDLIEYLEDQIMSNPLLDMPDNAEKQSIEVVKLDDAAANNTATETLPRSQNIDWKEYYSASDYSNHDHFYYSSDDADISAIERIPYENATLTDYLMLQLNTCEIDEDKYVIGTMIIEAIDDAGYLASAVEEIADEGGVDAIDVRETLEMIQQFDPPGVGAANLKECLLIQINQISQTEQSDIDLELPRRIIEYHLKDMADNKIANITRSQRVSTREAQRACDFIKTLEPKPGRNFASEEQIKYIIPDIIIEKVNDGFTINISPKAVPKLKINKRYKKYLSYKTEKDAEIIKYLNDKLNAATWLIKSVEQRRNTIYKLVESILHNQKEFFEMGKAHLKTLTLKQVADEIGVHISTVSRAASGKYLQCAFGVFELKYFFDSGVSNKSGRIASSKSVKEMIHRIIKSEDVKKPQSDQRITEILAERGIQISRRTVAKYRAMLGVQSSPKRKRY